MSDFPDGNLLEGFMKRGKTKFLSLTFDPDLNEDFFRNGKLKLAATVTDSFLHKLDHPADLPGLIAPSVRRALNHFFRPSDDRAVLDPDGDDEDGPGEALGLTVLVC